MTPVQITMAFAAAASLYFLLLYLETLDPPCPQHRTPQQIRDRSTTSSGRNPQIEERGHLY